MNHDTASSQVSDYDATAAVQEVTEIANRVLVTSELAEHRLTQSELVLDGQHPLEWLTTAPGIVDVKALLARVALGVHT